ncbi:MAG: imidazole glycerol phosphate synthase subunit HisH [Eggerthellaceae bacterium]|nr:imidazole glycerol phosphate synthase subunit HisH [Eggerthellaceae bacterium]
MICLIDYDKGNLRSVQRGLEAAGAAVVVSRAPEDITRASGLVLPGVGAFTDAMRTLEATGQADAVRDAVREGVPFLGICLGMHLMFQFGEEHAKTGELTPGLGIIPGVVRKMPKEDSRGVAHKVPHVGWNTVDVTDDALFEGIPSGTHFYFTHSFMAPESACTVGTTTHSVTFPSAVRSGNAYGVQFHPEKSSDAGALLLEDFVRIVERA